MQRPVVVLEDLIVFLDVRQLLIEEEKEAARGRE